MQPGEDGGSEAQLPQQSRDLGLLLLAEDEAVTRADLAAELARVGYRVVEAGDPSRVQGAIRTRGDEFAAVLLDVNLGAGPNGYALAQDLRAMHPRLPVLFMTADGAAPYVAESLGYAGFVTKPFHHEALVAALRRLVS